MLGFWRSRNGARAAIPGLVWMRVARGVWGQRRHFADAIACTGCGARLQSDRPDEQVGYIRKSKLLRLLGRPQDEVAAAAAREAASARTLSPAQLQKRARQAERDEFQDRVYADALRAMAPEVKELVQVPHAEGEEPSIPRAEDECPILCARCHSLTHHSGARLDQPGEYYMPARCDHDALQSFVSQSRNQRDLVVFVVDALDFPNSARPANTIFPEADLRNKTIVVAVNRIDLISRSDEKVLQIMRFYAKHVVRELDGFAVKSIVLTSGKKGWGVSNLQDEINRLSRPDQRIIFTGASNSGKSTLINALARRTPLQPEKGKRKQKVVQSHVPGTTIAPIEIDQDILNRKIGPIGGAVFDTPGTDNSVSLARYVDPADLESISPKGYLSGHNVYMPPDKILILGGLVTLEVQPLPGQAMTGQVYVLNCSRCQTQLSTAQRAAAILSSVPTDAQLRQKILPNFPVAERLQTALEFDLKGCTMNRGLYADILVHGLGWITIGGDFGAAHFTVKSIDGVGVTLRLDPVSQMGFNPKRKIILDREGNRVRCRT